MHPVEMPGARPGALKPMRWSGAMEKPGQAPTVLGPHGHRNNAAAEVGCVWYLGTGSSRCTGSGAAPAPAPALRVPWHCRLWRGAARAPAPESRSWWDLPWQRCQLQAWASSGSSTSPGTHKAEAPVMGMASPHPACLSSLLPWLAGPAGHGAPLPSCRAPPRAEPGGKGFPCCPTWLLPLSRAD